MVYGSILNTLEEWWNAGLLTIILQGVIVYVGLLWLGGIIWTVRDSVVRSESILFHIIAFLLSILTVPGIILYLLIRPAQTVAERKILALEEEILTTAQQTELEHKPLKARKIHTKTPARTIK